LLVRLEILVDPPTTFGREVETLTPGAFLPPDEIPRTSLDDEVKVGYHENMNRFYWTAPIRYKWASSIIREE
jgi:hypothetical protein